MSRVVSLDSAKWIAVFLAYPVAGGLGRLLANPAEGLVFAFVCAAVAGGSRSDATFPQPSGSAQQPSVSVCPL
jgi:hypothetical protein